MPDMISHSERAAIDAFLASGRVTKLPPCCLRLEGAIPREDVGKPIVDVRPTYKANHDAIMRKGQKKAENSEEKRRSKEERRQKAAAHLAECNRLADEKRLGTYMRILGHDKWTNAKLEECARAMSTSVRMVRKFLRRHGHEDKLPSQRYSNGSKGAEVANSMTPAEAAERDAKIVAAYVAGMPMKRMERVFCLGEARITTIVRKAGIQDRAPIRMGRAATASEQAEAAIVADYKAGVLMSEIKRRHKVCNRTVGRIARKHGIPIRRKVCPLGQPSKEDRIAADLYINDTPLMVVGKKMGGWSTSRVKGALRRCGIKPRSMEDAKRIQNERHGYMEMAVKAIGLHLQGYRTPRIAKEVGYADPSSVRHLIRRWSEGAYADDTRFPPPPADLFTKAAE